MGEKTFEIYLLYKLVVREKVLERKEARLLKELKVGKKMIWEKEIGVFCYPQ